MSISDKTDTPGELLRRARQFITGDLNLPCLPEESDRQCMNRCKDALLKDIDEALSDPSERKPIPLPADANGKRPRLFYFEETENCWCPAEGLEVENIISADNFLSNGEIIEIQFKREDMTDAEFDAIPEG